MLFLETIVLVLMISTDLQAKLSSIQPSAASIAASFFAVVAWVLSGVTSLDMRQVLGLWLISLYEAGFATDTASVMVEAERFVVSGRFTHFSTWASPEQSICLRCWK